MKVIPIRTPLFKRGDNLPSFLASNLPTLNENAIVAVTSKIVALSQNKAISLDRKEKYIRAHSKKVLKTPWALLTLTDEGWCVNAGADESNADGAVIPLPDQPHAVANALRKFLMHRHFLKHLGIIITDTRSIPLRRGTIGRAIGYAGFEPTKSYVGKKDLFGRKSRHTESNIADALAASAVLVMGEGNEQSPMAIITDAAVHFVSRERKHLPHELTLSPEKDLYATVFAHAARASHKISKKKRL